MVVLPTPRNVEGFQPVGQSMLAFPLSQLEWEPSQQLRTTYEMAVGASYAINTSGSAPAPKSVATENVRFFALGDAEDLDIHVDTLKATLYMAGMGRLWTIGADGERRWAWAQLQNTPTVRVTIDNFQHLPVTLAFQRFSDWMAEDETVYTEVITSTPHDFTILNAGTAQVEALTIEYLANAANGFRQPALVNLSNGYSVSSSRQAANGAVLRIDSGAYRVEYASNGTTFAGDYANVTTAATQVSLMRLEPGSNNMRYINEGGSGTNLELTVRFYPQFH